MRKLELKITVEQHEPWLAMSTKMTLHLPVNETAFRRAEELLLKQMQTSTRNIVSVNIYDFKEIA